MYHLASKDYTLCNGMIPLGSCTMKLNSVYQLEPLMWDKVADIHPFVPEEYALGYKEARDMIRENKFDYIIDIRSEREFNAGRFPGAIHIPLDELREKVKLYDLSSNILFLIIL